VTNPQIIAALAQLTDAVRKLTERQIIGEGSHKQTSKDLEALGKSMNKDIEALTREVEKLTAAIDPVSTHYRGQEAVVKARAQIHQEEQARRGYWNEALAPLRSALMHPLTVVFAGAVAGLIANWFGLELPQKSADVPTVIMENAGSTLTRAEIGPRGQG